MSQTVQTSPPKRRGLPRWFKVTVLVVLVLANVAVLGALWAARTGASFLEAARPDHDVTDELDAPSGGDPTFLVVGSDSREGLDDLTNFGNFGGARADVVMLVRVNGSNSRVQMLSLPRDLWVQIPGHQDNRINAAYALGGSSKLVETIRHNFDVQINHYVEVDFVGFQNLVDELGGIRMNFPHAARDTRSGLNVPAGDQVIDGRTALAYSRSRYYQENQGGSWVSVEANDIGRTKRQQEVMRAIMGSLRSPSSIADAGNLATTVAQHVTIDANLASSSIPSLAWDLRGVLTGSTEGATLPTTGRNMGGAQVLIAKDPEAATMLAAFRDGREFAAGGSPAAVGR